MFWLLLQTIACKNQKFLCGLVPCTELEILQHTIARNWVQAQPVGLRSPPLRILFFYEKSIQKRIKEEVSSLISPRAENLSESFEEWNNRSILGDNDTKLYFSTIYNIVSPPQSLRDAPPCLSQKPRLLQRRIFPLYLVIIIRNPYSKRRCFS